MRRTTIALEETLLTQLKREAARRGGTMQDLVNDLLKQALRQRPRGGYAPELPTVKGTLLPGVRFDDRDALFELMDGR
jgi:hypothetical protein